VADDTVASAFNSVTNHCPEIQMGKDLVWSFDLMVLRVFPDRIVQCRAAVSDYAFNPPVQLDGSTAIPKYNDGTNGNPYARSTCRRRSLGPTKMARRIGAQTGIDGARNPPGSIHIPAQCPPLGRWSRRDSSMTRRAEGRSVKKQVVSPLAACLILIELHEVLRADSASQPSRCAPKPGHSSDPRYLSR